VTHIEVKRIALAEPVYGPDRFRLRYFRRPHVLWQTVVCFDLTPLIPYAELLIVGGEGNEPVKDQPVFVMFSHANTVNSMFSVRVF
jgi:hypothetical protein